MEQFSLWGTLVNVATVILGSTTGLLLKRFVLARPRRKKAKLDSDESLSCTVLKGLGLCVVLFGIQGAITGKSAPVIILSMAVGGLLGTLLDLDGKVVVLGDWIEKKLDGRFGRVSEGFVSACLLFCVGAMAITGPLESGLVRDAIYQGNTRPCCFGGSCLIAWLRRDAVCRHSACISRRHHLACRVDGTASQ